MNESISTGTINGDITQMLFFFVIGVVLMGCALMIVYAEKKSSFPSDLGYTLSVLLAIIPLSVGWVCLLIAYQFLMFVYG